jgi:predicted component of type VI protein secretion system
MEKSELIAEFKAQLASFERYQGFIDKARSYAERFNPIVVEKVIADNTLRIQEVAAVLDPMVGQMRQVIGGLEDQRDGITRGAEDSRIALEELELRAAIGEIDETEFELNTEGLKAELASVDERLAEVDAELGDYRGTLDSWLSARPDVAAETELLGDLEDDPEEENIDLDMDGGEDIDVADEAPSAQPPSAQGVEDDVSAVFETQEDAPLEAEDAGIDFSPNEISDLGDDLLAEEARAAAAPAAPAATRAVLILGEGTHEEHLYPVSVEGITIGRGRDNTIQVKNDSKVSRQHCRVFRRDQGFFVEDNKSANGTSVDGELITEKRLVGGEVVVVGETQFRFRIEAG